MDYAIEDTCEALSKIADLATMKHVVDNQLRQLGFDRFAYHLMRPPDGPRVPLAMTTYPSDWTDRYAEQGYVNTDPVVGAAVGRLIPFQWDSLMRGRYWTKQQRDILNEAGDFKLRNGITVPVHGPGHGAATLNVTSDSSRQDADGLWAEHRMDLLLLAFYMHESVIAKIDTDAPAPIFHLAPREKECLIWTARGKTAWEVSQILNLSEETVVGYLKSAITRLGVHSKTHAVAKSILLGLITP